MKLRSILSKNPKLKSAAYITVLLVLTLGISALFYTPFFTHPGEYIISQSEEGGDITYNWNFFHFQQYLEGKEPLLHTHLQFAPMGNSLLLNANGWTGSVAMIFTDNIWFGIWLSYVFHTCLFVVGVFFLAGHFLSHRGIRVAAALIAAFLPMKTIFFQVGHYNLTLIGFLPWALWAMGHVVTNPRKMGYWLVLFSFAVLVLLSEYIYAWLLVLILGIVGLWYLWERYIRFWPVWRQPVLLAVVILVSHYTHDGILALGYQDNAARYFQYDLIHYLVPPDNLLLYNDSLIGTWVANKVVYSDTHLNSGFMGLGQYLLLLCLCIWGVRAGLNSDNRRYSLLAFVLVAMLVASLTEMSVFGLRLFKSPFSLLHFIPFIQEHRVAFRLAIFVGILLPILIGMLIYRLPNTRTRTIILVAWPLVTLTEFVPVNLSMLSVSEHSIPKVFKEIAKQPVGNLLPIPISFRDGRVAYGNSFNSVILYQPVHKQPLVSGYLSRMDQATADYFYKDDLFSYLINFSKDSNCNLSLTDKQAMSLRTHKIRYILIRPDYLVAAKACLLPAIQPLIDWQASHDGYLLLKLQD
jgi:hypothetical protein